MPDKTGSCLCGAVAFEITGPLRSVIACHCHQCRKQTGTYMSSTAVKDEQFRLTETRGLKWYRSSNTGRRGFCEQCGSVLFWKGDGYDYIAIAAGSIDGKLGVTLDGHIFCDSAGDYYQITGGRFSGTRTPQGEINIFALHGLPLGAREKVSALQHPAATNGANLLCCRP